MATQGTTVPDGQYSVRQVSDMLDLSPRQIRALVADGSLTPTIGARRISDTAPALGEELLVVTRHLHYQFFEALGRTLGIA